MKLLSNRYYPLVFQLINEGSYSIFNFGIHNFHLQLIKSYPKFSYCYALDVLKGPFSEGEPIIATDATYSRRYAFDVLKGRFHLGEPAIATDGWQSARYACELLNAPFPLGEAAIHSDPDALNYYLNHVVFNK